MQGQEKNSDSRLQCKAKKKTRIQGSGSDFFHTFADVVAFWS